jgi:hypothetical protein
MTYIGGIVKKTASKNEFTPAVHSYGPTILFLLASVQYELSVKKITSANKNRFCTSGVVDMTYSSCSTNFDEINLDINMILNFI